MSGPAQNAFRALPSVDELLRQPVVANLQAEFPRTEIVRAVRLVLEASREAIAAGGSAATELPELALAIRQVLYERQRPSLRRVINATGIVLHTGLGRAPLAEEALEAVTEAAVGYCNLEVDLATGERGDRHHHLRELLRELTGAEDGLVVNNNAAATWLVLQTLTAGREVIVSRGELVEIGGSYRMPDIMAAAGCRLVEVGTTNRTRIADYERAIGEQTAALLHVHTSNYRIQGFVESPRLEALVALAGGRAGLLVIHDLGSGLLCDPRRLERGDALELPAWDEPLVPDSVSAGADLTLFSGDKLLGGPQAGVIIGRHAWIEKLRRNPLTRALRPDKLTLAALEATLRLYRDPETALRRVPVLRMLVTDAAQLEAEARRLELALRPVVAGGAVACEADRSYAGGGSLPTVALPTWVLRVTHERIAAGELAAALRLREVPIICRIRDGAVVLDVRTIRREDEELLVAGMADTVRELLDR